MSRMRIGGFARRVRLHTSIAPLSRTISILNSVDPSTLDTSSIASSIASSMTMDIS